MGLLDEIQNSVASLGVTAVNAVDSYRKITGNGIGTPQTAAPAQTLPNNPTPELDTNDNTSGGGLLDVLKAYSKPLAIGGGVLFGVVVLALLLRRRR